MHPITLRLPTDLLSELDEEADEAGFSNRSEYIRHLLQNRKDASELFSSDTESATSEHEASEELVNTVGELNTGLTAVEDRVDDLEEVVEEIRSEIESKGDPTEQPDTTEAASSEDAPIDTDATTGEAEQTHDLGPLEEWLQTDGPESDDAQAVMRDAARMLTDQGPLSAKELRTQLFNRYPDAYDSADALWSSTVQRLYEDAPGFSKPKYGTYDYGPE